MHVVLDEELAGVALGVVQVHVEPQLVRDAHVLRVDRLSAVLERLWEVQRHGEPVALVKEMVGIIDALRNHVSRVLGHRRFRRCYLDVDLVGHSSPGIIAEELSRLYQFHLNVPYLDAFSERYQHVVSRDRGPHNVILPGYCDLVGDFVGPDILVDLLHGHGLHKVSA